MQIMEPHNNPVSQPSVPAAQGLATGAGKDSRTAGVGVIGLVLAVIIAALWWMNLAGQDDMRETVAQELARRDATIEQRLAYRHVAQLGSSDQFAGADVRRLAGQHFLHLRIVGAVGLHELAERVAELLRLEVVVNRRR